MKLQISHVADKGIANKERLIFKVLVDTDVGEFAVFQTGYNENGVTIGVHHTYWFPYKKVIARDLVVIYTKAGENSEKPIAGGGTAHFFYWGLNSPIWGTKSRAAVLLHAREWESKRPEEL